MLNTHRPGVGYPIGASGGHLFDASISHCLNIILPLCCTACILWYFIYTCTAYQNHHFTRRHYQHVCAKICSLQRHARAQEFLHPSHKTNSKKTADYFCRPYLVLIMASALLLYNKTQCVRVAWPQKTKLSNTLPLSLARFSSYPTDHLTMPQQWISYISLRLAAVLHKLWQLTSHMALQ